MVEPGIGLSLFNEMEARFWLSGYTHSENRWRVSLVPASGEPFLVIRALDAAALRDRSWLSDIVTFRDWCGNGAMVRPVRHCQTKGAATDMPSLQKPRHIPTLPDSDIGGAGL